MRPARRLEWTSSVGGDPKVLAELDRAMTAFYSRPEQRAQYQAMLTRKADEPLAAGSPGDHLLAAVMAAAPAGEVLEVGCGSGWLYRHLLGRGFSGRYIGLDVPDHVIAGNRGRHPEARWEAGSVYALPVAGQSVDVCFAFYVLEHTVWPERALTQMLRVVRPGGQCLLVFPDFVAAGSLSSQQTGLTPGTGRDKLAARRLWDAAVTWYDSRVRVRRAIGRAAGRFGPFPVNTRPLCLTRPDLMWADIDAVYLASGREVAEWAAGQGYAADRPAGADGEFERHAFLRIRKPDR